MPSGHEGGSEWVRPVPRDRPSGRGPAPRPSRYDEPLYEGPVYEGPVYEGPVYGAGGRLGDATWPGESVRGRHPRSAIHDPWRERRRLSLPSGLPTGPTVFVALAAVVLAFLLGRASGGGGNEPVVAAETASTTAAPVATQLTAAPLYHTVQENESLSGIAAQYGLTLTELAFANNIGNTNHVERGQRLLIPPPTTLPPPTTEPKKKNE